MLTALMLRPDLEVSVLHDRNPLYVKLSDGGLRNGYTVKLLNKLYQPRSFSLGVKGCRGATLSIDRRTTQQTDPVVTVPPDELQSLRLYVTLDKERVAALRGEGRQTSPSWSRIDGHMAVARAQSDLPGARAMTRKGVARQRPRRPACADGSHRLLRRDASSPTGSSSISPLATFSGGDTSDPYRKGLHYNETLAAAERQAERGWQDRDRL